MKTFNLYALAIGCILPTLCAIASATAITPGQTEKGTISAPGQKNPYTFAGVAGQVLDFTLTATSGTLIPKIELYNPSGTLIASNYSGSPYGCSGSVVELNTVKLVTTGTYTVDVSDCSDTNTGNYALYMQQTDSPTGQPNLPFGSTESGTISSPAESATYTFSGKVGETVDFTLTTTSGSLIPKIRLYNPVGTLNSSNYAGSPYGCSGSTLEMNTVTLPETGVYTVLVGDCADTDTGNFDIYAQVTENPSPNKPLLFGQAQTGSIGASAQSDTYTFTANANDVIYFAMTTTKGNLIPKIRVYNPNGTLNISNYSGSPYGCSGSTVELPTGKLTAGAYTVLVGDCSDTNTGNYVIYSQRLNKPSSVVGLLFGQQQTGLIGSAAQSSTYTFSGNAGDVIYFAMTTTTGSLIPKIRVYNPDGSPNSGNYSGSPYGCSGSTVELTTAKLVSAGMYTALVGDCGDTNTGNYAIYSQRLNNPVDPVPILWGQVQPGTISSAAQSSTYSFSGSAGDTVDFTVVTTSGALIPKIRLYNPDGSPNSDNYSGSPYGCSGTAVELNSVKLKLTGTYTVLVGDCGDTNVGKYNLSSQCFGVCTLPVTSSPVFAPPAGTYSKPMTVTITDATPGAKIYCTTNGTTPTTSSPQCSAIVVSAPETIKAFAAAAGHKSSPVVIATYNFMAATPVFTPPGGMYAGPLSVAITDGTPGATIYYTTDGSSPATSATRIKYTTRIAVSASNSTVRAIAAYPNYTNSAIASATYIFVASTPIITPPGGTYTSVKLVTITDLTPGAVIHYTTNGTAPTTGSPTYTVPIVVSSSETIDAIAVAPNYANSAVAKAVYVIIGSPSALAAPATAITTSSATLNALVNTLGLTGSYSFEFGTSITALTANTARTALTASKLPMNASVLLTGLKTKTTYYFQILVTTAGGSSFGSVQSFTTN